MVSIMTGNIDDLFNDQTNLDSLLTNWQMHCAFVLKSLSQGRTSDKFSNTKKFISRLALAILEKKNDIAAYLLLSILVDQFDFSHLQETSKTNLMNVDLRVNTLLTLLVKLSLKTCSDK